MIRLASAFMFAATSAMAHDGHPAPSGHVHWEMIALAVLVALPVIAWQRRK